MIKVENLSKDYLLKKKEPGLSGALKGLIKTEYKTDCYCKGDDEKLIVLITDVKLQNKLPSFIEEKTHLFHQRIEVHVVNEIQRNETGKVINQ